MLDKATGKLASAQLCFDAGFFDDASSRAYYAAFHAITAALDVRGKNTSSHGQTMGAFNREFVKNGPLEPQAFRRLQRLFANRQAGDYDASVSIESAQAAEDIDDARWLVEQCTLLVTDSHCFGTTEIATPSTQEHSGSHEAHVWGSSEKTKPDTGRK